MRLSSLKTLFITLLLFAVSATGFARSVDAQKYVPLKGDFWRGYPVDGFTIDTHDNISVTIPAYEMVYFRAPERLSLHSADSIRVWCSVEDGAVLTVGTAIDTNNDLVMGTLTLGHCHTERTMCPSSSRRKGLIPTRITSSSQRSEAHPLWTLQSCSCQISRLKILRP
jgi:hypothetical protein